MTPHELYHAVRTIEPGDLAWHAQRYDSGEQFRDMVICARQGGNGRGQEVAPDNLGAWVAQIAQACQDDGGPKGYMPCLGGTPLTIWIALLRAYLPTCEGARLYRQEGR
jgi:hypothetical protein